MMVHRFCCCVVAVLLATTLGLVAPAGATQKYGPFELSGNLQSQNLIRHPDVETYQYIQNRNVARLRFEYSWLEAGKFMSMYDIPFIQTSKLFVQWRGVYDSVYDTTPGFAPRSDIHGNAYGGRKLPEFLRVSGFSRNLLQLDGLTSGEQNAFKFENTLREAYVDLKLRPIPLSIRAGKQQVVWGETDNFRMLDRANSLDLTWHLQQEIPAPAFGWDEIRRTFWMLKFLYDIGDVYGLSQTFLEWYWNPGDWYPAKQSYLPRPWGLPFLDPLDNPVDGAFRSSFCAGSRVRRVGPPGLKTGACRSLMNGTTLFGQGNYERNPFENSQVGVRLHAITPFQLEWALVYFYQRWSGDDGTNYAPLRGLLKNPRNIARSQRLIERGIFPAEAFMPYVHSIGGSANYSDEQYTQAVLRFETIYDVGVPFFDVARETVIDTPALPGVRKKNMWKGMIAFDRPTWIRWLNKKSTWFLTGQFFWHYLVNNPDCQAEVVAQLSSAGKRRVGSCLVGGLDLPSSRRLGTVSAAELGSPAYRDKIRDWEALFTFAAFSFYRGGSIIPVLGIAADPVNQWNLEPFWNVDYVLRNDLVFNIGQRYFVQPRGHTNPIFETWGLAGFNQGRSETTIRLTYQF